MVFHLLDNRSQKCLVNGSLSERCTLKCGIPQGTILGPLLFCPIVCLILNQECMLMIPIQTPIMLPMEAHYFMT